jgi:hypothetical protein
MIDKIEMDIAAIGVRLLDNAYLAWFGAETECEHALHAWFQRTGDQRATAYFAYRAALDREEAAARDLERVWQLAAPCRHPALRPAESAAE